MKSIKESNTLWSIVQVVEEYYFAILIILSMFLFAILTIFYFQTEFASMCIKLIREALPQPFNNLLFDYMLLSVCLLVYQMLQLVLLVWEIITTVSKLQSSSKSKTNIGLRKFKNFLRIVLFVGYVLILDCGYTEILFYILLFLILDAVVLLLSTKRYLPLFLLHNTNRYQVMLFRTELCS